MRFAQQEEALDKFTIQHANPPMPIPLLTSGAPAFNRHNLRYRTQRQGEIQGKSRLNVQRNVRLDDRLKTWFGYLNAVRSRRQVRNKIDTLLIRLAWILHPRGVVHHQHVRSGDRRATRVIHDSADRSDEGDCAEDE